MRALIIAIASFSGVCAFAFLLAGWAALLALDQPEIDAVARRTGTPRGRGFWRMFSFFWHACWQADRAIIVRAPLHWRDRPEARLLILLGMAFFIAAVIGLSWILATMPGQPWTA